MCTHFRLISFAFLHIAIYQMATFLPPSTSWILPPSALPTLPSILDNTCSSVSVEKLKRRKTCRFIEEAAKRLKLPQLAAATAMVFFHRFFTKQSFGEFDRFEVAVAALFLSTKVEVSDREMERWSDGAMERSSEMDKAFLRFGDSLLVRSCGGKDLAIGSVAINSTNYYTSKSHQLTQFVFALNSFSHLLRSAQETPRKLVVVVETCWQLKNASSRGSTVLTAAGQPQTKPEPTQSQKTVEINVLKEKVLLLEVSERVSE